MHLSIVIPTYNEENRIIETLSKVKSYLSLQSFEFEVILVDDGSIDSTKDLIESFIESNKEFRLLKNKISEGKGSAVKKGILNSKGEFVLFTDSDLSAPIEELDRLMYWLYQGYDLAVGSRYIYDPFVEVNNSLVNKILGKTFNSVVKKLVNPLFNDSQCSFKGFKREVAYEIFSNQKLTNNIGFNIEILYLAMKNNLNCKEVAINWNKYNSNKINFIRIYREVFNDIVKIKSLHKNIGLYRKQSKALA